MKYSVPMERWQVFLLVALFVSVAEARTVYEVPVDPTANVLGVQDANIVVCRVEFDGPTILSRIEIPLAIRGEQTCTLWLFHQLNQPAVAQIPFTNVSAGGTFDFTTYTFELDLQVPRVLYVGVSAQGDGWGANLADYWECGTVAVAGTPDTLGTFYWGPVVGGQVSQSFFAGPLYGALRIEAKPVTFSTLEPAGGDWQIQIDHLPLYGTNWLEQTDLSLPPTWVPVAGGELPWSAAGIQLPFPFTDESGQKYRVRTE